MGKQTAHASAVALHLNSKQLISLEQAVIQLQPASVPGVSGGGRTGSPGLHAPSSSQQPHAAESTSADSPSSSIFDAFASSPMKARHGAISPVKSPSKLGARGLPVTAQPTSPAQFAGSPARLPDRGTSPDAASPAHNVTALPPTTAWRRPTLSPLVLDADSPSQTAAGVGSLPGVFVPRVSPAASGEHLQRPMLPRADLTAG